MSGFYRVTAPVKGSHYFEAFGQTLQLLCPAPTYISCIECSVIEEVITNTEGS
jgi:hypothetical protein